MGKAGGGAREASLGMRTRTVLGRGTRDDDSEIAIMRSILVWVKLVLGDARPDGIGMTGSAPSYVIGKG